MSALPTTIFVRKGNATPVRITETDITDWTIPGHAPKYYEALEHVPKNGAWYVLNPRMGLTTAEQLARGMQTPWGPWQWGYRNYHDSGELYSALAVRYNPNREGALK